MKEMIKNESDANFFQFFQILDQFLCLAVRFDQNVVSFWWLPQTKPLWQGTSIPLPSGKNKTTDIEIFRDFSIDLI